MSRRFDIKRLVRFGMLLALIVLFVSACKSGEVTEQDIEKAKETTGICWQKDIFDPIFDIVGKTAMSMHIELTSASVTVVMLGFAVWLAMKLLKYVSSPIEGSPAQVWNEIIRKAFICLFCGFLASNAGMVAVVINDLIFPFYSAFLEFGYDIMSLANDDTITSLQVMGETLDLSKHSLLCNLSGEIQAVQEGFPTPMKDTMGCMLCAVADRIDLGKDIALKAVASGTLLAIVVGLLIWAIFLVVGFGFVFYLIDSIFRMGMMILFLPLFIIAYAFESTRKFTKVCFENILNSSAFMMAFSMIIAMTLMAMVSLISANPGIFNPDIPEAHAQNLSLATLCLLMIAFLIYGSMNVAKTLTGTIIGGKTSSIFQQNLKATAQLALNLLLMIVAMPLGSMMAKTQVARRYGNLKARFNALAGRRPKKKKNLFGNSKNKKDREEVEDK